jgi:hypothetical protein
MVGAAPPWASRFLHRFVVPEGQKTDRVQGGAIVPRLLFAGLTGFGTKSRPRRIHCGETDKGKPEADGRRVLSHVRLAVAYSSSRFRSRTAPLAALVANAA